MDFLRTKIRSHQVNSNDYILLILRAAKYFTTVFFIFDALDEWERNGARRELLHCINAIQTGGNVKILVTSRPHISLGGILRDMESIEIRTNMSDVERYIRATLNSYDHIGARFKEEVVARLTSMPAGT